MITGSGLLCTQCEAMGFRRITFHFDRPDILSKYKVRLEANKEKFPGKCSLVRIGGKKDNLYLLWDRNELINFTANGTII